MAMDAGLRRSRLSAVRREEERVTPLELFFDLVFVLAITQCTTLMAAQPTWEGLARGGLMLGVLWWSLVGYAWLTSVIDPEEGAVRLAMFAAMAALLVVSLCVPDAFDGLALAFAIGYAVVRVAHIALFLLASRDDPALRKSVIGLAVSTAVGSGLLVGASFLHGTAQEALWAVALGLDMAGPFFFGAQGWRLVPGHFAERHGLIVIIALGESIVSIGVGAEGGVTAGVATAAVLGMAVAAGMWWVYFDVAAIAVAARLSGTAAGQSQNELARDAYSYLHFPMVLGIVLVALGLKITLAHVAEPLEAVPAVALLGGVALYLLGQVAFKYRSLGSLTRARLLLAAALLALLPAARHVDALVTLALVAVLLAALVAFEGIRYATTREQVRHEHAPAPRPP